MPENLKTKQMEKEHVEEYFDLLFPEIEMETHLQPTVRNKKAAEEDIPDISDETGEEVPGEIGEEPSPLPSEEEEVSEEEVNSLRKQISELKDMLQNAEFNLKLESIKAELIQEVEDLTKDIREELAEFKETKIPKRKYYDTGGAYKEQLFEMATRILDESLPDVFDVIPDYSLIATQISRTFDDGTVSDGIITVNVMVPSNEYRFDFKIDVPILHGVIQSPLYIQRGLKIIPLTKDALQEELNSISFRKVDLDYQTNKPNLFSNIGENIHRKPDSQKAYAMTGRETQSTGAPINSTWTNNKTHGGTATKHKSTSFKKY